MSLAQKAGQAGTLLIFRKGYSAIIGFGVMAYLARVLEKEDFGIVAISATLITLIQVVAISGISEYLIFYKGEDEKRVINAGFWLNMFATTLVCAVVLVVTPYWTSFYGDERIAYIVYMLLIGFFFNMLSAIPMALFRKSLDYKPMILIQTIFGTVSNVSQIGFAFYGFGVYSLALPHAVITPLMTITLFWRSGFFPQREWGIIYWKNIIQYTKYVIGQRVLGKLVNEGDTLIIGKFFGVEVLGVYNLAFQFANLFAGHFLPIITSITLPVFAKNNNNLGIVTHHYHKMVRLIAFITVPVIAVMILNAEFLITTIYGAKWIDAVLLFQIISVFVIVRSITSPTSGLYNAMGMPQIGWYFTLTFTPVFLAIIFVTSLFSNLLLLVVMTSLIRGLGSFTHFILVARLLNDKLCSVMRTLFPIMASTTIAFCLAYFIPSGSPIYVVIRVLLFALTIWFLLKGFWGKDYGLLMRDLLSMLPKKLRKFIAVLA
ncbi:MAG: oligosaccharide flippase family protein [Cyclobacteriaceae bacterium]|nr:oligosaccharide flippase family protein [Cyclobacteriaceae bacterium]